MTWKKGIPGFSVGSMGDMIGTTNKTDITPTRVNSNLKFSKTAPGPKSQTLELAVWENETCNIADYCDPVSSWVLRRFATAASKSEIWHTRYTMTLDYVTCCFMEITCYFMEITWYLIKITWYFSDVVSGVSMSRGDGYRAVLVR